MDNDLHYPFCITFFIVSMDVKAIKIKAIFNSLTMKLNYLLLIVILLYVFFISCIRTTQNVKSSQKEISSFSLLLINNRNLPSGINGNISGDKIFILPGATKTLIANFFSSDKSKVYVGSTEKESGITINDFSNPTGIIE